MFKAKLISNNNFYILRSSNFRLSILSAIAIGLLANFYAIPTWLLISVLFTTVFIFYFSWKNIKSMNEIKSNSVIEMDDKEIRIKSQKDNNQEIIPIDNVEKLITKNKYAFPHLTTRDFIQEIKGISKKNYFIVHQGKQERKFYFELDSEYTILQLNEVIRRWTSKGIQIEKVS